MFKKYQLKNGMKVVLIESHKSPVLSIQMWVKTGSADEKKSEEGISHFIEHLVFKGTERFNVGEIAATVEGAGGELNAYTSFDQTVFYVTISKEFRRIGLEVIAQMMGHPTFDENEIDNEREVVIEEIKRSNDSPHRQASRLLFSTVYKKHPYGVPVIGYPENVKSMSRDTIKKYFKSRYNPQNMTLVVAGDFSSGDLKREVQDLFGRFERTNLRSVKRPKSLKAKKESVIVEKAPFAETIIHIAFPIPSAKHKDIAALEAFAMILGQGESSRLNHRLRMTEHLVNYAGSGAFVARDPGFFSVSLSLNQKDLVAALTALQDEILNALAAPPSAKEVKKAITNFASEQFYSQETVDGLARNFGHYQDLFNDPAYFTKFLKHAQSLTGLDIMKAARKYLDTQAFTMIVMTPENKDTVEPIVKKWVKSFRHSMKSIKSKNRVKAEKKAKKVSFIFPRPRKPQDQIQKWDLPGGATLITRPNHDTPVVSIRCASLGGSRLETRETQGATELLSRVWTAGCGPFSEKDVNEKCDEMAASLSAFAGRNSEGLTMSCLRPFLDDMLDLMTMTLRDPMFEGPAVTREVKSMQEHVKLRQDNPSQLCIQEFMKGLFGSHPYGRDPYGDPATIGHLDQTHVRHIFRQKSGLAIVASGAFDAHDLKDKLEAELKDLHPKHLECKKVPLQYPKEEQRLFLHSEKEQSHIIMGYPGLSFSDPRRYDLQVMQAVLAGQGGRLFVELRDKASLAYSVAPLRMEGLEGGYFGAYIGCSPDKAATALKMMTLEFQKLVENVISDDEIGRAKRYLIGKHDIDLQRNSSLTAAILFDFIYGIDYLESFHFAERLEAVTAASVRRLATNIFAAPPVLSVVGPRAPW